MDDTKRCSICNCEKPLTDFYQWPNKKIKVSAYCKACTREKVRAREKAKPEQVRATKERWLGRNREKMAAYFMKYRADPERREKARQRTKEWLAANPERAQDHGRRRKYGLPYGAYSQMLAEQDGKCFLCGTNKPGGRGAFHVDHCHSTGSVRKLLCHSCNLMLGHSKDDPTLLRRAADYVEGLLPERRIEGTSAFNSHEKLLVE